MTSSIPRAAVALAAGFAATASACGPTEPASVPSPSVTGTTVTAGGASGGAATPSNAAPEGEPPPRGTLPACRLPAAVRSQDKCVVDSDCAPRDPCHAVACVGRAKANPPKADTVCTRSIDCSSVDVNRCGCMDGTCALVPPT